MRELKFSYNWNNKLNCPMFTTLRAFSELREGEIIYVKPPEGDNFTARVIARKDILMNQITPYIAGIDTGYTVAECKMILLRMYKNKGVDWRTHKLKFYLLQKVR